MSGKSSLSNVTLKLLSTNKNLTEVDKALYYRVVVKTSTTLRRLMAYKFKIASLKVIILL